MIDYAAIRNLVDRQFCCDHPSVCLTYQVTLAGTTLYRRQCRRCGERLDKVRKGDLGPADREGLVPYDPSIQRKWWKRKEDTYTNLADIAKEREARELADAEERERREWRARYEAVIASPDWRRKRQLVIKRCNGVCEGCGLRSVDHIHHLTYNHLGDELLFELVGICLVCHEKIHPGKVLTAEGSK